MTNFEHFSFFFLLFQVFIYVLYYLFIRHSSASSLIHLSIFAPTCQPPGCVQRQKKCQHPGEEIKAKPECGRRPAGDRRAAKQPRLQGVSQVNCSSTAMKKCLISRPHHSTAAFALICFLSKPAAVEENPEHSDGLINSHVSPLPASCSRHNVCAVLPELKEISFFYSCMYLLISLIHLQSFPNLQLLSLCWIQAPNGANCQWQRIKCQHVAHKRE